eukprot:TRINITY_DN2934_c0_g1_i4.p1 TRINITY_DN2934_c0_g1~~TRINITY_DN2934_c0_g1_i4.p1  ORF type:complete len:825 (-),score=286.27 TRINITY_DN2934_c0_g1_i4:57-2474(-)
MASDQQQSEPMFQQAIKRLSLTPVVASPSGAKGKLAPAGKDSNRTNTPAKAKQPVRYSEKLRDTEVQLEQQQRRYRVLEREKRLLEQELQRTKAVVNSIIAEEAGQQRDAPCSPSVGSLANTAAEAHEKVQELTKQLLAAQEKIKELQESSQKSTDSAEFATSASKVQELEDELSTVRMHLDSEVTKIAEIAPRAEMADKLMMEKMALENSLSDAHADIAQETAKALEACSARDALKVDLADCQRQLTETTAKLQSTTKDLEESQRKLAALQSAYDELKQASDLATSDSEKAELSTALAKAQQENKMLTEEKAAAEKRLKEAHVACESLKRELTNTHQQLSKVEYELVMTPRGGMRPTSLEQFLKSDTAAPQFTGGSGGSGSEKELSSMREEVSFLRGEVDKRAKLEQDIKSQLSRYIVAVQQQKQMTNEKLSAMEEQLTQRKKRCTKYKKERHQLATAVSALQQRLAEVQEQSAASKETGETDQQLREVDKELSALHEKVTSLKRKLEREKARSTAAKKEFKLREAQLNEEQEALQSFRSRAGSVCADSATASKSSDISSSSPPPHESEDSDDENKMSDKKCEENLAKCINELVATEKTYVDSLDVLVQVFLKPLDIQGDQLGCSSQARRNIFSSVEIIKNYNRVFYSKIDKAVKASPTSPQLGPIFSEICGFLKVYTMYVSNYEVAVSTLTDLCRNSDFNTWLEHASQDPRLKNLDIYAYLIMPVQRIPRYVLLLQNLCRFASKSQPDYPQLVEAFEKMKDVATHINEKKRDVEAMFKVFGFSDHRFISRMTTAHDKISPWKE